MDLASRVLAERSIGAASAEVAELVTAAAVNAGVRIGTTHILNDTVRYRVFQQVAVRTAVTSDIASLMRLLSTLEASPTVLSIRDLTVTQLNVASGDREPELLRTELTVAALMRPNGGSQP